jgi:uncharacterized protein
MQGLFTIVVLSAALTSFSQIDSSYYGESIRFIAEQNEHYTNKETSPLDKKARKAFAGHCWYDVDLSYVVPAHFARITNGDTVVMKTSADTEKAYIKYAQLHFNLGRSHCHLMVYQSLTLREMEEFKNYLFIPFKDLTSGNETYGGGRYMDITIPEGDEIILNFNTAYNPYCAYADGYFCPVPPAENTLNVEIRAGAMAPEGH